MRQYTASKLEAASLLSLILSDKIGGVMQTVERRISAAAGRPSAVFCNRRHISPGSQSKTCVVSFSPQIVFTSNLIDRRPAASPTSLYLPRLSLKAVESSSVEPAFYEPPRGLLRLPPPFLPPILPRPTHLFPSPSISSVRRSSWRGRRSGVTGSAASIISPPRSAAEADLHQHIVIFDMTDGPSR